MENKEYKNKNMIRTKHNVVRVICFNSSDEMDRFYDMYEYEFDTINKIGLDRRFKKYCIAGKITKSSFDKIVKDLQLINFQVNDGYTKKTRYWRFEKAQ